MGLFDNLLEVAICFDWLSPLAAFAGHVSHGGGHTFSIVDGGYTGREVEKMLRKEGVTTWGLQHPAFSDCVLVSVPKEQAQQAQSVLDANGVVTNSAPPKGSKQAKGKGKKKAYQPGKGWSLFS